MNQYLDVQSFICTCVCAHVLKNSVNFLLDDQSFIISRESCGNKVKIPTPRKGDLCVHNTYPIS